MSKLYNIISDIKRLLTINADFLDNPFPTVSQLANRYMQLAELFERTGDLNNLMDHMKVLFAATGVDNDNKLLLHILERACEECVNKLKLDSIEEGKIYTTILRLRDTIDSALLIAEFADDATLQNIAQDMQRNDYDVNTDRRLGEVVEQVLSIDIKARDNFYTQLDEKLQLDNIVTDPRFLLALSNQYIKSITTKLWKNLLNQGQIYLPPEDNINYRNAITHQIATINNTIFSINKRRIKDKNIGNLDMILIEATKELRKVVNTYMPGYATAKNILMFLLPVLLLVRAMTKAPNEGFFFKNIKNKILNNFNQQVTPQLNRLLAD